MEENHGAGGSGSAQTANNGASTAANGSSNGTTNGITRRRRPSTLSDVAAALPTVESSLESFSSRANSTILDVGGWAIGDASPAATEAEQKRADVEAARIREAVANARAEAALEHDILRRTIDDLNVKIAAADAKLASAESKIAWHVANASSAAGQSAAPDPALTEHIAELQAQLEQAEQRVAAAANAANIKVQQAEMRVTAAEARAQTAARASVVSAPLAPAVGIDEGMADRLRQSEERARSAELRANKALAAARAAAAGLTVSNADLDQIQAGLPPSDDFRAAAAPKKALSMPLVIGGAFIGALAVMFVVSQLLKKPAPTIVVQPVPTPAVAAPAPTPAPAPAPVVVQPAPAPAPAVVQPTPVPAAPVAVQPAPVTAQPIEVAPAPVVVKPHPVDPAPVVVKPHPVDTAPVATHTPAAVKDTAAPKAAKPAKTAKPAAADVVDPFASTPEPAPKAAPKPKKAAKPAPAAGIVDPF